MDKAVGHVQGRHTLSVSILHVHELASIVRDAMGTRSCWCVCICPKFTTQCQGPKKQALLGVVFPSCDLWPGEVPRGFATSQLQLPWTLGSRVEIDGKAQQLGGAGVCRKGPLPRQVPGPQDCGFPREAAGKTFLFSVLQGSQPTYHDPGSSPSR